MATTDNNITVGQIFDSMQTLLESYQSSPIAGSAEINSELKILASELSEINRKIDPATVPVVLDANNATTADIISVLVGQMRKTNELVGGQTLAQIRRQQQDMIAKNDEQMEKLKKADEAAKKAKELSDGLGIFRWVMLAVSVIMMIISAIATVFSFGAAAPSIAAAVTVLAVSAALLIVTSIPVDDSGHSAMDLATDSLSKAITKAATAAVKERYGDKWDKMSDAEQLEALQEANDTGSYSAMGIMMAIQVVIAIAMIVLTVGAGGGQAASNITNAAANTTQSGVRAAASNALQSVRTVLTQNAPRIVQTAKEINVSIAIAKAAGQIGASGVQMKAADLRLDSREDRIQSEQIAAMVRFLQNNNQLLLEIIEELNATSNRSYEQVAEFLKTQHQSHRKIAANAGGGASV